MVSILALFTRISELLAIGTLFLPIVASLITKKRNIAVKFDLKLFEIYIYFTFLLQTYAIVLSYGYGLNNLFLFRFYLPIHTAIFTYFLLKWLLVKNKNVILLVGLSIVISALGDFFMGESNTPPNFMLWFDAILLFGLSFYLSFINDKKKIYLPKEYNFIHIGIYIYSTITLIGLFLSQTGFINYSFFLQSVAVIISNYYFAWSFVCLFHFRGLFSSFSQ